MAQNTSVAACQKEAATCRMAGNRPLLAVAAGLALGLSACSAPRFATVESPEPELGAAAADLYESSYTSIVPRAFLNADDLDADAPDKYTVVKGDTLWDISDRFLKQPWLWATIWNYNPEIANPHLIYPGDELALEYINNRPSLVLSRNGKTLPLNTYGGHAGGTQVGPNGEPLLGAATPGVERLSPRIRSESLEQAIPLIESDSVGAFLVHPRVINPRDIRNAPYVLANIDRRLISAAGHEIYARGDIDPSITAYSIYRPGKRLVDPITGEFLGQELTQVANATLKAVGDPSTLLINSNERETIQGDVLLPRGLDNSSVDFTPRLPEIRGEGRVISMVNAIVQSGRDQVIVLNLGERSGIAPGDLLAIESHGATIVDPNGGRRFRDDRVRMPNTRTGVVMVFQTAEKVSYGLVMESSRPIRVDDIITGL